MRRPLALALKHITVPVPVPAVKCETAAIRYVLAEMHPMVLMRKRRRHGRTRNRDRGCRAGG